MKTKVNFAFFIAVFSLIFLGLSPYINLPLTDNEGIFSLIGRELSSGAKLYQAVWDHKPPFLFIHFWLLEKIVGNPEALLHLYVIAIHCLNAFLLFWLSKKWLGTNSWLSSVTYSILILPHYFQCWTPQAELLMEPFLLGGLLVVEGKQPWRWLLAGGFVACGFFTKQSFLFYLPLFFIGNSFVGTAEAVLFFGGLDIVAVLVISPFLLDGRLNQLWYAIWGFNELYVENGWVRFLRHPEFRNGVVLWLGKIFEVYGLFFVSAFFLTFIWAHKLITRRSQNGLFFPVLWFWISVAMVVTSGYFFPYYYIVLILPLSILVPVVLVKVYKSHIFYGALLSVLLIVGPILSWINVWQNGISALTWNNYLADRNIAAKEMGLYLKSISKPGDELLAWTMEPQVYVYSGLKMFSGLKTPLVDHLLVMPDEEVRMKMKFLDKRPAFILVSQYDQVNTPPDWLLQEIKGNWRAINIKDKLYLYVLK